jgi:hypothetical protein
MKMCVVCVLVCVSIRECVQIEMGRERESKMKLKCRQIGSEKEKTNKDGKQTFIVRQTKRKKRKTERLYVRVFTKRKRRERER